jgi:hypothetical protein
MCATSFIVKAIILSLAFLPLPVFGAELYFGTNTKEIGLQQYVEIGVFLNTEGEPINALEGSVSFPSPLLLPIEIRDGSSIISLWIEKPFLERDGALRFSGVIPGGYEGSNGYLFSAIFQAQKEGEAIFDIRDATTLLHDGKGTASSLRISPAQLAIGSQLQGPEVLTPYDIDAPESFVPEIAKDANLFDGKWFVVFATHDKASGIDHYKVRELRQGTPWFFQKWTRAQSPYLLSDQKLKSSIFIKAIDKRGNERIVVIPAQYPVIWYENYGILAILILGILISLFILWRRKLQKK